ncbi:hypothetical protein ACFQZZ_22125 [Nocardia sp. GCM10030253]|uniref:hypothetical protein n=1 Tax=Nocardia sp. GCM10030253 TaxID=3273404 RepID=UPI00364100C2
MSVRFWTAVSPHDRATPWWQLVNERLRQRGLRRECYVLEEISSPNCVDEPNFVVDAHDIALLKWAGCPLAVCGEYGAGSGGFG